MEIALIGTGPGSTVEPEFALSVDIWLAAVGDAGGTAAAIV